MPGIADAQLKFGWAKHHIEILNHKLGVYAANPYTFTREDDPKSQLHILRFKHANTDELCLIVGDIFYNMRSSLDQLVWSLARIKGFPGKTQWPTVEVLTKDTLNSFTKQLTGVPDEAICEIRYLQPYNRGDAFKTHPLWRLDEMCNLDKHRRMAFKSNALQVYFPNLTPRDHASGIVTIDSDDEGGVATIPIALKSKLDFNPTASVSIEFGGDISGICEPPQGIAEIYNFIAQKVFPRFTRFFPQSPNVV